MKNLKKLSVSKEIVETLNKKIMKSIVGGVTATCTGGGCATGAPSGTTLCSGNPAGCGSCTSGCSC